MQEREVWVRPNDILPCCVTGTGIEGVMLEVFRVSTGERLEGDGRIFPDREACLAFEIERGYVVPYLR